jgi:hypothetical protein
MGPQCKPVVQKLARVLAQRWFRERNTAKIAEEVHRQRVDKDGDGLRFRWGLVVLQHNKAVAAKPFMPKLNLWLLRSLVHPGKLGSLGQLVPKTPVFQFGPVLHQLVEACLAMAAAVISQVLDTRL